MNSIFNVSVVQITKMCKFLCGNFQIPPSEISGCHLILKITNPDLDIGVGQGTKKASVRGHKV